MMITSESFILAHFESYGLKLSTKIIIIIYILIRIDRKEEHYNADNCLFLDKKLLQHLLPHSTEEKEATIVRCHEKKLFEKCSFTKTLHLTG